MNVTLSIDEKLLEKAREVAESMGTSVNGLIRHYLEGLTSGAGVEGGGVARAGAPVGRGPRGPEGLEVQP